MIVFEKEKFLQNIRKNGIGAERDAEHKIKYLIAELVQNSTYSRGRIIGIVKNTAKEYYDRFPKELGETQIEKYYDDAKMAVAKHGTVDNHRDKIITIYESEMKAIASLEKDKLMRLAFASLVLHKFMGQHFENGNEKYHKEVEECKADIYRVAEVTNTSGTTRDRMWKKLNDAGIVLYSVKCNSAYDFNHDWICFTTFTVPINVDLKEDKTGEKVYKQISNYDDILQYLQYWLGDESLMECADCGRPIKKNGSAKRYCSNCAASRKKASMKTHYQQKKVIA